MLHDKWATITFPKAGDQNALERIDQFYLILQIAQNFKIALFMLHHIVIKLVVNDDVFEYSCFS